MKWLIKNPAPMDTRLEKWGDFHFGRSLTKYLVRQGQEVDVDYDPQWNNDKTADVTLVLRGKYPYQVKPDGIHILWNISHPESLSPEECNAYDLVFVASTTQAENLGKSVTVPVTALLQCTDTEEFYANEPGADEQRTDFVFVGNSRNAERPGVIWASELGLPLKVWGRMWNPWIDADKHLVGEYLDNRALGTLYRHSRVSLNDHWPDMKRHGYINNRVFDALACGLPLISDRHPALQALFPDEILYFSDKIELQYCIEEVLFNYPNVKKKVGRASDKIVAEYSFESRARTLIEAVESLNT